MVYVPDQLVWHCIKKRSCFQKKRNGNTKRSGAVTFSVEKGNLKSIHQHKYSGLANSKTIDVIFTKDHLAQLCKKTASKCHNKPKQAMPQINLKKQFAKTATNLQKVTSDVYYRPDLKAAMLGKYTKVYQANRRARGITKPVICKKGRGTLTYNT